jgi:hypothetical protein
MAGFRPYAGLKRLSALAKCLVDSAFPLRGEPRPAGRIFTPERAACTNSCREKNLENQLRSRYTLAGPLGSGVDQIQAPPSSFSVFRMNSAHALFALGEEVFRRRRDRCVQTDLGR